MTNDVASARTRMPVFLCVVLLKNRLFRLVFPVPDGNDDGFSIFIGLGAECGHNVCDSEIEVSGPARITASAAA